MTRPALPRLVFPTLLVACAAVPLAAQGQDLPDPDKLDFRDGVGRIPDRETFKKLSYQGLDVLIDTGLKDLEFVKYQIEGLDTDRPVLYFINTKTHRAHMMFMRAAGIGMGMRGGGFGRGRRGGPIRQMRGVLVYRPLLMAPNGKPGLFTIEYEPNDAYEFKMVKKSIDMLEEFAPITKGRIAYYPLPRAVAQYEADRKLYEAANIPVFFPEDAYKDIGFLPLNIAEGYGRLRLMRPDQRPGPRDVVLYPTLPNEMPRVAGVITAVRQTPLSHVNLRAIQDGVPNAFIKDATSDRSITGLIGKYVHYKVAADGFAIREATSAQVEKHFAALRPAQPQKLRRDLTVRAVRPLAEIGFGDAASVGVKAANLAVLGQLGFPAGTVPDGFAVPFHFYDAFMKHNGLYRKAAALRAAPGFATDAEARAKALSGFRKAIRAAAMPADLQAALGAVQQRLGGRPIRCRSSTNNEDLPGFSGAGLYDSCTHDPDEGHLARSIQQVYASLWNFRAYEEREFYRIDHAETAMGVLLHPNYSAERANGVAVTADIVYQAPGKYYVNVQVGEDLVTNPEQQSMPEELLLSPSEPRDDVLVSRSNRVPAGQTVLSAEHRAELRRHLGRIKRKFRRLYQRSRSAGEFAMEIEFKITAAGHLAIKQARPWVY